MPFGVSLSHTHTQLHIHTTDDEAVESVSSGAEVRTISTKAKDPEKKPKRYYSVIKALMKFF